MASIHGNVVVFPLVQRQTFAQKACKNSSGIGKTMPKKFLGIVNIQRIHLQVFYGTKGRKGIVVLFSDMFLLMLLYGMSICMYVCMVLLSNCLLFFYTQFSFSALFFVSLQQDMHEMKYNILDACFSRQKCHGFFSLLQYVSKELFTQAVANCVTIFCGLD